MLIYLIDDCKSELLCWERTFQLHEPEWKYKLCNNFDELNDALGEAIPDIVIVDYIMPFHSGVEVSKYLKQYYPTVPRIICSGMDAPEYQLLAAATGAGFISKSLPFQHRLEVIRGCCQHG